MGTTLGILSENIDFISQQAVHKMLSDPKAITKKTARLAVKEARTHLAKILDQKLVSPQGDLEQSEADVFADIVYAEAEGLQIEYGYSRVQACAVKIMELTRFQVVVEMAGDSKMLENVRRVKASMIQALGNADFFAKPSIA